MKCLGRQISQVKSHSGQQLVAAEQVSRRAVNYLLWYVKDLASFKYRQLTLDKSEGSSTDSVYTLVRLCDGSYRRMTDAERMDISLLPRDARVFRSDNITSARPARDNDVQKFDHNGQTYTPGKRTFATDQQGLRRLSRGGRIFPTAAKSVQYVRYLDDHSAMPISNIWNDTGTGSFTDQKVYVVQTASKVIQRCVLMTSDPGDLVLDPTCGSGTTA